MMKRFWNIMLLITILGGLSACSESYTAMYEDVEEEDHNVNGNEAENVGRMTILPTISDPLYSIQTTTRSGSGTFNKWALDYRHWLSARFDIFAYQVHNTFGGVFSLDNPLLNGVKLGVINEQGATNFYKADGTKTDYYFPSDNAEQRMTRHKFYALYSDDITPIYTKENSRYLRARLTGLDGRQDIMHSFAYHSDEQLKNAEAKMPNDETTKVFEENKDQLMYSAMSAYRGVQPIMNVNHLLTQFCVMVRGKHEDTDRQGIYPHLQLIVDSVQFYGPNDITVTVVDSEWESADYQTQEQEGKLITANTDNATFSTTLRMNEMKNNDYSKRDTRNIDFDMIGKELVEKGVVKSGQKYYWVGSNVADTLCSNILMVPEKIARMRVFCRYLILAQQSDGKYHLTRGSEGSFWIDKPENFNDITTNGLEENGNIFRPGVKYNLIITLYGLNKASVSVLPDSRWIQSDEDITLGEEDD